MKRVLTSVAALAMIGSMMTGLMADEKMSSSSQAPSTNQAALQVSSESHKQIKWYTDFNEALKVSQTSSKPLILFFTGSDWCGWCTKLRSEVLDTQQFADAVADQFVFVEIDFPMYKSLPAEQAQQNKELKEKYQIQGFPTLIVLDSTQHHIGTTGYRPESPQEYASHLLDIVRDDKVLDQTMANFDGTQMSSDKLEDLYQKATGMGRPDYANTILDAAVKQGNPSSFFLSEKYKQLVDQGKINDDATQQIRQQLLAKDPGNESEVQLYLAVIDFQFLAADNSGKNDPEKVINPLTTYIKKYGEQDQENMWRIRMTISQFLFGKGMVKEALEYAEAGYDTAPDEIRPEIEQYVEYLQNQVISKQPG